LIVEEGVWQGAGVDVAGKVNFAGVFETSVFVFNHNERLGKGAFSLSLLDF
jgi:hypothetical protein